MKASQSKLYAGTPRLYNRLIAAFSLLIALQFVITTFIYERNYRSNVIATVTDSAEKQANTDTLRISGEISGIRSAIGHMAVDEEFLNLILSSREAGFQARKRNMLNRIYNRYFTQYESYILSFRLLSRDFSVSIEGEELTWAAFYAKAPFADEMNRELRLLPPERPLTPGDDSSTIFTLVRRMYSTVVNENSSIIRPNASYATPYLVIEFNTRMFEPLENSLLTEHSMYGVALNDSPILLSKGASEAGVFTDTFDNYAGGIVTARSMGNALRYVNIIPVSDLTGTIWRSFGAALILIVLTSILMYVMMLLLTRNLFRPVNDLTRQVERIYTAAIFDGASTGREGDIERVSSTITYLNDYVNELSRENQEIAQREQDAMIQALEMQLNPHFLYNTLNCINMIAIGAEQDEISQIVVNLSNMMHYTFDTSNRFVCLRDELHFLEQYVFLMKKRFPERFDVEYQIPDEALDCVIPKMILQLTVENSILHGFRKEDKGGRITLYADLQDEQLRLRVVDDGMGISDQDIVVIEQGKADHIGCANINKRLKLLFGEQYGLWVASPRHPTVIEILVPKFLYQREGDKFLQ